MDTHKVIKRFKERHQDMKIYEEGDPYTYENKERIAFLIEKGYLEKKNKHPPQAKSNPEIKHTGGGWYELPDGKKVKGKANALKALESGV